MHSEEYKSLEKQYLVNDFLDRGYVLRNMVNICLTNSKEYNVKVETIAPMFYECKYGKSKCKMIQMNDEIYYIPEIDNEIFEVLFSIAPETPISKDCFNGSCAIANKLESRKNRVTIFFIMIQVFIFY